MDCHLCDCQNKCHLGKLTLIFLRLKPPPKYDTLRKRKLKKKKSFWSNFFFLQSNVILHYIRHKTLQSSQILKHTAGTNQSTREAGCCIVLSRWKSTFLNADDVRIILEKLDSCTPYLEGPGSFEMCLI